MSDDKAPENEAKIAEQSIAQKIGVRLQEARASQNVDMATIANRLRLQHVYLEALERGDWEALPDQVYALGFLRQYADALRIDVSQEIDLLKTGVFVLKPAHTISDPGTVLGSTWFRWGFIVFLIAFVIINVVYFSKKTPFQLDVESLTSTAVEVIPDLMTTPVLEESTNTITQSEADISSFATEEVVADVVPDPIEEAQLQAQVALNEQALLDQYAQQNVETVATILHTGLNVSAPLELVAEESKVNQSLHQYQFSAEGQDVWVEISNPSKQILLSVLIPSGTTKVVQHRSPFLYLTSGNIFALSVRLDDILILSAGELGKSGQVVRRRKISLPAVADKSL
ncbi:MAG: helix-turn-helix domain-containing protein [Mariprofundaceae bacterium]|nr:helix-turn-helix domain-containing protein [Mariprofundaceae bacterium]